MLSTIYFDVKTLFNKLTFLETIQLKELKSDKLVPGTYYAGFVQIGRLPFKGEKL